MIASAGELDRKQRLEGRLLFRACGMAVAEDFALLEGLVHLVLDVLLEAADDQALAAEVLLAVVLRVGDGRRVQHVHQAGEAAGAAVVRAWPRA